MEEVFEIKKSYLKNWKFLKDKNKTKIKRIYKLENFEKVMYFVNKVADLAKREDIYPEILISFKNVEIFLSKSKEKELSDFINKIEDIFKDLSLIY